MPEIKLNVVASGSPKTTLEVAVAVDSRIPLKFRVLCDNLADAKQLGLRTGVADALIIRIDTFSADDVGNRYFTGQLLQMVNKKVQGFWDGPEQRWTHFLVHSMW